MRFEVYTDGVLAYQSPVMTQADPALSIQVPVIGVNVLRLVVTDGGNGAACDHADWGGARLEGCVNPAQARWSAPALLAWLDVEALAEHEHVRLHWKTQAGPAVTSYQIERARDGHTFEAIGTVAADPAQGSVQYYALTDADAGQDLNHYRVRALTADGRTALSEVRTVQLAALTPVLLAYPNPVSRQGQLTVDANLPAAGTLHLTLYNLQGQPVYRHVVEVPGTQAFVQLPVADLAAGVYLLRSSWGGWQQTLRIVVQD
ncbi:MAG: hypothetical protein OHK0039_44620 [Bacteroidia bacterium]